MEGTRESHPHVHDLQHPRLGKPRPWLQIMDTRMGFPCPLHSVVIDSINLYISYGEGTPECVDCKCSNAVNSDFCDVTLLKMQICMPICAYSSFVHVSCEVTMYALRHFMPILLVVKNVTEVFLWSQSIFHVKFLINNIINKSNYKLRFQFTWDHVGTDFHL